MTNLLQNCKVTKILDHSTAASTDVESDIVDMAGFEGVLIMTSFGTAAVDNILKAQQNTVNSTAGFADLVGSALAPGASDEDAVLDIFRPQERYVKVVAVRGTSSTVESIWAVQYGARYRPVTNAVSGTGAAESHFEPAEGTA